MARLLIDAVRSVQHTRNGRNADLRLLRHVVDRYVRHRGTVSFQRFLSLQRLRPFGRFEPEIVAHEE